jgi:hypothetical protein
MAIKVICPNPACGKPLKVADHFGGNMGQCPACLTRFLIPLPEGAARPAPPEPAAPRAGTPPHLVMPTAGSPMYPPPVRHWPPTAAAPHQAPPQEWFGDQPPPRPSDQATPQPAAAETNTSMPRPPSQAIQPAPRPPAPPAAGPPMAMFEVVDEAPAYQPQAPPPAYQSAARPPTPPGDPPPAPSFEVVNQGSGYEVIDDEDDSLPYAVKDERPISAPNWPGAAPPVRSDEYRGGFGPYGDEYDDGDQGREEPGLLSRYYTPRKARIGSRSAWRIVSVGLLIAGIGAGCGVVVYFLLLLGNIIALGTNYRDAQSIAGGLGGIAAMGLGIIIFGGVMGLALLVGFGLCVAAPPKHGAKGFAIAALSLLVTGGLFVICAFAANSKALIIVAAVLGLAWYVTSALFLRAVAECMRDHPLAESCVDLIKLIAGVVGGLILLFGIIFAILNGTQPSIATAIRVLLVGQIVASVAYIGVWARYFMLIWAARASVENRL